jgi:hypothetical protein
MREFSFLVHNRGTTYSDYHEIAREEDKELFDFAQECLTKAILKRRLSLSRTYALPRIYFQKAWENKFEKIAPEEYVLKLLEQAKADKLPAVEIYSDNVIASLDQSKEFRSRFDALKANAEKIQAFAQENHIDIITHAWGEGFRDLRGQYRFPSAAEDRQLFDEWLEFSKEIGAKVITVHLADPWSQEELGGIAEFIERAAEAGIKVGIENTHYNDSQVTASGIVELYNRGLHNYQEFGDALIYLYERRLTPQGRKSLGITLDVSKAMHSVDPLTGSLTTDILWYYDELTSLPYDIPLLNIHFSQASHERYTKDLIYKNSPLPLIEFLDRLSEEGYRGYINLEINGDILPPVGIHDDRKNGLPLSDFIQPLVIANLPAKIVVDVKKIFSGYVQEKIRAHSDIFEISPDDTIEIQFENDKDLEKKKLMVFVLDKKSRTENKQVFTIKGYSRLLSDLAICWHSNASAYDRELAEKTMESHADEMIRDYCRRNKISIPSKRLNEEVGPDFMIKDYNSAYARKHTLKIAKGILRLPAEIKDQYRGAYISVGVDPDGLITVYLSEVAERQRKRKLYQNKMYSVFYQKTDNNGTIKIDGGLRDALRQKFNVETGKEFVYIIGDGYVELVPEKEFTAAQRTRRWIANIETNIRHWTGKSGQPGARNHIAHLKEQCIEIIENNRENRWFKSTFGRMLSTLAGDEGIKQDRVISELTADLLAVHTKPLGGTVKAPINPLQLSGSSLVQVVKPADPCSISRQAASLMKNEYQRQLSEDVLASIRNKTYAEVAREPDIAKLGLLNAIGMKAFSITVTDKRVGKKIGNIIFGTDTLVEVYAASVRDETAGSAVTVLSLFDDGTLGTGNKELLLGRGALALLYDLSQAKEHTPLRQKAGELFADGRFSPDMVELAGADAVLAHPQVLNDEYTDRFGNTVFVFNGENYEAVEKRPSLLPGDLRINRDALGSLASD